MHSLNKKINDTIFKWCVIFRKILKKESGATHGYFLAIFPIYFYNTCNQLLLSSKLKLDQVKFNKLNLMSRKLNIFEIIFP